MKDASDGAASPPADEPGPARPVTDADLVKQIAERHLYRVIGSTERIQHPGQTRPTRSQA